MSSAKLTHEHERLMRGGALPKARITDIDCTIIRLPNVQPIGDGCQAVAIISVETDIGITGIGEVHTNPSVTKAIIDAPLCHSATDGLRNVLVGENPFDIRRLWDKMRQYTVIYGGRGAGVHAISGIDIALWDLLGKAVNLPVWQLLGGRNNEIKLYASDLAPASFDEAIASATKHVENGFNAVKFGWGNLGRDRQEDVQFINQVREALGDNVDIMVDLGVPIPFDEALYRGEAFADYGVYFMEEPLAPTDIEGFHRLVARSPTPIATGEKEDTLAPYVDLIDRGGLQIIQPDVARVGGITEALRISGYAEARGVQVIPHCWATDILVGASLSVISTVRNCPYLEFNVTENPFRTDLASTPFVPQNGCLSLLDRPGIGVELNRDVIDQYRWEG